MKFHLLTLHYGFISPKPSMHKGGVVILLTAAELIRENILPLQEFNVVSVYLFVEVLHFCSNRLCSSWRDSNFNLVYV